MVPITALWLPILLSAVLVFLASSIIHMLLRYHSGDLKKLPSEDRIGQAFREANVPPGDYVIPHAGSGKEWSSPEFAEKMRRGPVATMTVRPSRTWAMGPTFLQWFLFSVLVSVFAAYLTGRAVPPGGEYLEVFRFAGTVTFVGYCLALWGDSVWFGRKWSTVMKYSLDALIYGLLVGGVFGWLWPG